MITLDEIFRRFGPAYLAQFSGTMLGSHKRAIEAICSCLTPELGGHVYQCEDCGAEHVILHSCRNRACLRCQTQARNDWLDARAKEILPVRYFHAVFTVPHELALIIRSNQKELLSLLMRTSAEAVQKLALDKKFLGGQVGILAVLHTWGSTLEYHPHFHCLIPGGAITENGTELLRVRMFLYQSSKYPVPATEKKKPILACTACGSVKLRLTEVRFPSKRSPPQ